MGGESYMNSWNLKLPTYNVNSIILIFSDFQNEEEGIYSAWCPQDEGRFMWCILHLKGGVEA